MDPVAIAPAAVRVTFAPGETLPLVEVSPAALIGPETTIPPRAAMPIPPGWPAERSTPRPALESMPPETRTSPPLIATAPPLPPSTTPAPGTSRPQLATVPRTLTSPPDEASSIDAPARQTVGVGTRGGIASRAPGVAADEHAGAAMHDDVVAGSMQRLGDDEPGGVDRDAARMAAVPAVSTPPPSETRPLGWRGSRRGGSCRSARAGRSRARSRRRPTR